MLVFFLVCGFLQTLWGKPVSPPLEPGTGVTANMACVMEYECPAACADGGQQLRSVYDIVQSCLFTIFACVWSSIHPNINGPRDSWWTCAKRRVVTTLYAVIAPEIVFLWALNQRIAAKEIADRHNMDFKTMRETEISMWASFKQLFQRRPKSTTRRGARQPWTITHGFSIQMGGFILYENEYPKEVLTYDRLAELLQGGVIDAPTVTERELQDRSKGDTISKSIVLLQTTWFVLQCIVRAAQRLPLSELEVLTLAFAVMNGAIYVAWWSKPQGVDMAVCVPSKQLETGNVPDKSHPMQAASSHQTDHQHSEDNQPLIQSDEDMDKTDSWLRRKLRKDRKNYSSPVFLFRLPYHLFRQMLRPLTKMFALFDDNKEELRMPMFYTAYKSDNFGTPEYIAVAVGLIFGAIHLLGWPLGFPSPLDRTLWQISAVILTVAPIVFLVCNAVATLRDTTKNTGIIAHLTLFLFFVFATLSPFYIAARFVVIAIAIKGIFHPPNNVLLDVSWTRYIPHF